MEYDNNTIPLHTTAANGGQVEDTPMVYRVAGFWIRFLAFAIDLLVIAALSSILWDSLLASPSRPGFLNEILHSNSLFLGLTGSVYLIIMTRLWQQTLGKMIVGIKVVQRNGEPLSWSTVVFRELIARSLSHLMGLNLGYLVCWFNAEKRCAHDFLSDTWVVHDKIGYNSNYISLPACK